MNRPFVKLSSKLQSISNFKYQRHHHVTLDGIGGSHYHNSSDTFRLGKIILPLLMFSVLLYLIPYIRIDKSSYDPNGINNDQLINIKRPNLSNGQQQPCTKPVSNIFFLKTHKCASSAIQRIFLKYGYLNQKLFALPASGNYLGHPEPFDRSLLSEPFYGKYNIFAVHTRFNLAQVAAVMPPSTLYITILRNPLFLYESMFGYWNLTKFYHLPRNFLDLPSIPIEQLQTVRWIHKIGANQMFFDLGYDPIQLTNDQIDAILPKLDQIFDLVMIAERFDESLILLKDKLCWSFDDIITFKINARPQRKSLSPLAEERIKIINWADLKLYSYFSAIFDRKVKAYGINRMNSALAELRSREAVWYSECVYNETISWGKSTSSVVRFINRKPSNLTCVLLTATELEVIILSEGNNENFIQDQLDVGEATKKKQWSLVKNKVYSKKTIKSLSIGCTIMILKCIALLASRDLQLFCFHADQSMFKINLVMIFWSFCIFSLDSKN